MSAGIDGIVRVDEGAKPVTLWRYYLSNKNHEGWAEIVIGSSGFFAAVSDYGNYAFAWRSMGCDDARRFFLHTDWHYLSTKLCGPEGRIYDGDATAKAIREAIIELRRSGDMTRQTARQEWDCVEEYEVEESEAGFNRWGEQTELEEWWECHKRCFRGDLVAFCKVTMPRLAEAIRAELESEASR